MNMALQTTLDCELKEMVRTHGMTAVLRSLCNVVESERQESYIRRLYCDLWTALDNYDMRYVWRERGNSDG